MGRDTGATHQVSQTAGLSVGRKPWSSNTEPLMGRQSTCPKVRQHKTKSSLKIVLLQGLDRNVDSTCFRYLYNQNLYLKKECRGTSLVVQCLRIFPPMQGTQVQLLVQELRSHMTQGNWAHMHHNYWSPCSLEPMFCNKRSFHNEKPKPLLTTTTESLLTATKTQNSHLPARKMSKMGEVWMWCVMDKSSLLNWSFRCGNEADFGSLYFKWQGVAICHLSHLGVNLRSISSCFHSAVVN